MSLTTIQKEFYKCYSDKVGERYFPTYGRDGKIFKELLMLLGPERLSECIKAYFETEQKIYSPVYFKCRINDMIQITKKPKKTKLVCDDSERYF